MQSNQQITLYGIPNCDTVKKARVWLQEYQGNFVFHDFKKNGLDRETVEKWLTQVGLDVLINRKGTTWRALSDEQKAGAANTEQAIALILNSPSLVKRPVLCITRIENAADSKALTVNVGFSPAQYHTIFNIAP
ncbi:arsenate reductase [Undibacterium sp. Ren11W]|uniref:arsenate reductase n=1 Tax=Undibacterium sp. Ren11W TaxID=3413045 RepID=UPI003BF18A25